MDGYITLGGGGGISLAIEGRIFKANMFTGKYNEKIVLEKGNRVLVQGIPKHLIRTGTAPTEINGYKCDDNPYVIVDVLNDNRFILERDGVTGGVINLSQLESIDGNVVKEKATVTVNTYDDFATGYYKNGWIPTDIEVTDELLLEMENYLKAKKSLGLPPNFKLERNK
jgi:hypothetical protein